jgi:hypothetical protein
MPIPQVDEDTTSLMSGIQGSNSAPSILLSEAGKFQGGLTPSSFGLGSSMLIYAGVNLAERPERFSHMAPQTDLDHFAAAYGSRNPYDNVRSSTAYPSGPRKFTAVGGHEFVLLRILYANSASLGRTLASPRSTTGPRR